jgi:hypothetical protein
MRRAAITGAVVGAVIPLGFWIAYTFFGYMFGWETGVLWPSSIVLMALETQRSFVVVIVVWIGSWLVNVVLYALLGLCLYTIYRVASVLYHGASTKRRSDA